MAKKYNYEDNFEMLVLRHDYLSRVSNADPGWIKEFKPVVKKTAWVMYYKLRPNFAKVGYDLDDIELLSNCYMVSYMDLYSLRRNPKKLNNINKRYLNKYGRDATSKEILNKEKINMINFIRQRLVSTALVCSRKARNITVDYDRKAAFAYTEDSQAADEELIYSDCKEYGYRKLTNNEYQEIKKKAKLNKNNKLVDKYGYPIIEIEMLGDKISNEDYQSLFVDHKTDGYHMHPEEYLENAESEIELSGIVEKFRELEDSEKKKKIRKFIRNNKGKKYYKQELKYARKILKNL